MAMLSRTFAVIALLGGGLLGALPAALPAAWAQDASGWAQGHSSRVRLLAGGEAPAGPVAGIQVELDPGFKTYWRTPGEAGLPPAFDWSKSVNVDSAEVLWPVPTRFEDPGGIIYGYQGSVLLPVRIRAHDATKPVTLAVKLDYGVCKDICIPAQAELFLTLPKSAAPNASSRSAIDGALARVPRQKPLGVEGALTILAVEPSVVDGKPHLKVSVRAPPGRSPGLFVEAPENWFLLASAEPIGSVPGGGTPAFLVEILERPADASGPVDLRLTLAAGDTAIETTTSLDAAQLGR